MMKRMNKSKDSKSSKYRGVSWCPQLEMWRARIKAYGKSEHLGYYPTEEDAARAYDKRSFEVNNHSGFANFPKDFSDASSAPSSIMAIAPTPSSNATSPLASSHASNGNLTSMVYSPSLPSSPSYQFESKQTESESSLSPLPQCDTTPNTISPVCPSFKNHHHMPFNNTTNIFSSFEQTKKRSSWDDAPSIISNNGVHNPFVQNKRMRIEFPIKTTAVNPISQPRMVMVQPIQMPLCTNRQTIAPVNMMDRLVMKNNILNQMYFNEQYNRLRNSLFQMHSIKQ